MRPDILTCNARYFDLTRPEASHIDIETIAHALSNICRFTGHTDRFYSVAQHSILVSHLVPPEHALAGLLHDAHEAYCGDVAAPLKQLLPDYQAIEARIEAAVRAYFGLPATLPAAVKHADLCALVTERRDLMPHHDDVWVFDSNVGVVQPCNNRIIPAQAYIARCLFLDRYRELTDPQWVPARRETDWSAA